MYQNNFNIERVKEYFAAINDETHLKVKKKYLKAEPQDFDIEIIVRSLLTVDIPLNNVFDIIDRVVKSIKQDFSPNSTIDSDKITDLVKNAILSLEHDNKYVWGLEFEKMFNKRGYVQIEDENGQVLDDLTTENVRKKIITEIAGTLNISEDEIKDRFKDLTSWAGEVKDIIKRMGTSSISEKTLESIISDLAFKPPKPWISGNKLDSEQINEHIKGIEKQLELIGFFYKTQKIDDAKMQALRVLDDISELVLNKYGILYDSSPTKPFYKLHALVKETIKGNIKEDFSEFEKDIQHLNYTIHKVSEVCNFFRDDNIKTTSYESFHKVISRLELLFTLGKRIYLKTSLIQLWEGCLKSVDEKERFIRLKLLLEEILKEGKGFTIKDTFANAILLEPESGVPIINAFGNKIYCRIHPFDKRLDTKDIFDFLGEFISDTKGLKYIKIGLSISLHGVNKIDYKDFKKSIRIDKLILFFDKEDVEQLIRNPENFQILMEDKLSKYLIGIEPIGIPHISNNVPIFERKNLIKAWNSYKEGSFSASGSLCVDVVESFILDYIIYILKIIHGNSWLDDSRKYSQKSKTLKHWTLGEIINTLSTNEINTAFNSNSSKFFKGHELKDKILTGYEKELANSITRIRADYLAHKLGQGSIAEIKIHKLWISTQELVDSISAKGFFPFIIYVHKREKNRIFGVNQYGTKIIVDFTDISPQIINGNLYYLIPIEKTEQTKSYIYIKSGHVIRYGLICHNCKEKELFLPETYCDNCGKKIEVPEMLAEYIKESKTTISEFIGKLEDKQIQKLPEPEQIAIRNLPEIRTEIQFTESEKKLIQEMFEEFQSVYVINEFTSGFSESRVLKIKLKDKKDDFQIPQIIKIGPSDQIKEEIDNYNLYVNNYLNKGEHAEVSLHKEYSGSGGICYHCVGGDAHKMISFGDYYKKCTIDETINLLTQLYKFTLNPWYRNRKLDQLNLYNEYVSPLLRNEKISNFIEGEFEIKDDKIYIEELGKYYINPLIFLKNLNTNFWQETYISTVHGDLNSNNIQIDDKNLIWLIDFYKTKKGHLIKDFTKLETVIKFELMEIKNLKSFLSFECILTDNFDLTKDLLKNLFLDAELKNAFLCIKTIRENIADLSNQSKFFFVEYLTSLLFYTLSPLAWDNFSSTSKKNAFYSATLIADKINMLYSN